MAENRIYFKPGYGLKSRYQEYTADEKKTVMYLTSDTDEIILRDKIYSTKHIGKESIDIKLADDNNSKIVSLVIDPNEKVLSQSSTGLLSTCSIVKLDNPATGLASQYALVGKDGTTKLGVTIDLVKDQFLKEAVIITEATQADKDIESTVVIGDPYIKLTFVTTGTDKICYVAIKQLIQPYLAGNGISITYDTTKREYTVAVRLDPDSETYLTVGAGGLKFTGLDAIWNTIKAYTVNGKKISENPVLAGADIKLTGYTKEPVDVIPAENLAETDTVSKAFNKLENIIEEDELVIAAALHEHQNKIITLQTKLTWDVRE